MNKSEVKQLMAKYLLPAIEGHGYKERKIRSSDFSFVRNTAMGLDEIMGGFNDYNPVQKILYSVQKSHKPVVDILLQLQADGITLNPKVDKNSATMGFSYCTLNGIRGHIYLPEMQTEEEVQQNVNMMVRFLEETAFPLLNKFEDVREIDRIINGPEPWAMDYLKPYAFGLYFYLKRLIFAKLSGLGNYDRVLEFLRKEYGSRVNDKDGSVYRTILNEIEELNKLIANVKSLY
jgi:hypothetical protein